jgi:hypothetical protein
MEYAKETQPMTEVAPISRTLFTQEESIVQQTASGGVSNQQMVLNWCAQESRHR